MEQFSTDLKILAQNCEFSAATVDQMIRDRIVCGVVSAKAREKLLDKGSGLTLSEAISITRTFETTQAYLSTLAVIPPVKVKEEVDSISYQRGKRASQSQANPSAADGRARLCYRCGDPYNATHREVCKAKNATCNKCGTAGHFSKVCRSKAVHSIEPELDATTATASLPLILDGIEVDATTCSPSHDFPKANVKIGGCKQPLVFKLDTGSAVNAISYTTVSQFYPSPRISPSTRILQAYGGRPIPNMGTCILSCTAGRVEKSLEFFVIGSPVTPILGYSACLAFGLVSVKSVDSIGVIKTNSSLQDVSLPDAISSFADLFKWMGKMDGLIHIHTRPEVRPVVRPARRLAFTVEPRITAELKRMVDLGVIRRVTKPTPWVNGMVVTEKSCGDIRICLDPRDLNEAIIRPHYPIPTFDDIAAQVNGYKLFTKLDATSAYWMLQLDDESSDLTTFNTPEGRFQYTRLAFGLSCAQDILQQRLEQAFSGIKCSIIADDIVVGGKTEAEHDQRLEAVFKRAVQLNIKFNPAKLHYKKESIPYFGHLLSSTGIQPDPFKLKALEQIPYLKDHVELASFLGMVNYLLRFIKCLATLNYPLRQLAQQNDFTWVNVHSQAVDKIIYNFQPPTLRSCYAGTRDDN